MIGLMQHHPLLISSLIEHAAKVHQSAEIVSHMPGAPAHRCSYVDVARRARQLAQAVMALGIREGDRVGTMAWNGYRHLELFFGVSGMGAVLHTVNPRLFPEQIAYIVNHAENQVLFFDVGFAPLVATLAKQLNSVRHFVVMTDRDHMPAEAIPNLLCYEDLVAAQDGALEWPMLDERSASSLCYTSGTTGNPKGVLYTHRSTLLHASLACMTDGMGMSARDMLFMASPMFHVNAWGMPYACALSGASMVLPGSGLDGASIYAAMKAERVTVALGVPTVWMGLQQHVATQGLKPREDLCLERVLIGGAAAPRAVVERFANEFGTRVLHAWGMTETSPLATLANPLRKHRDLTTEQYVTLQAKQGRVPYGVEIKLVDDDGKAVPHDGQAVGHLLVRGHWIASGYFRSEGGAILDEENWFDTGDIATIDADGYMQITDRAKDLIKSGGEWISSIALENAAVGHPSVAEAAVIAIAHEKWQERPLMLVVRRPGQVVSKKDLLDFLAERVATWWLPDDIVFVDDLPHTATGKLQKMKLRQMYGAHRPTGR
ncbi:MAG: long-chain-fatty-acid--CoA ligase [Betaproteobacteria bacterium]|jgi:acyl-CoA synthetase (AMP-forming)/AMP-acid ligase II